MDAIILAGGFGTRLHHLVPDVPKPLAPINGRPFLRYILDLLAEQKIERTVLAVGYKAEKIVNFFGNSYRGMELKYSVEASPLLTGGAIKNALPLCRGNSVFVLNGDTFFNINLNKLLKFKQEKNASLVIACRNTDETSRYGTLSIDKNYRVLDFYEKKYSSNINVINCGIYLFNKNFFNGIIKTSFSLEKEIFNVDFFKRNRIFSYISNEYFIDIGIPKDYQKAQIELIKFTKQNKAVFFDRDGTINVDTHYLYKKTDFKFIQGMPNFIKKWNDWGYKVIVITNQSGIARNLFAERDVNILHQYINKELKKFNAHIDAFYFCPHHPDFTGKCLCRKPEPGLFKKAIHEFDLKASECIMFGDKQSDIDAAKKCGIMGVLVNS